MRHPLVLSLAVVAALLSGRAAEAQVDKVLTHVVSWVLQQQIDEYEKANDPNRPAKEFDPQGRFEAGNQFAPRSTGSDGQHPAYRADFSPGNASPIYPPAAR